MGKSTLLTALTGTKSEAAAYEFTTLTCIPGVIHYNDAKIQLLDLPGIIEGAAEGKGVRLIMLAMSPEHTSSLSALRSSICIVGAPYESLVFDNAMRLRASTAFHLQRLLICCLTLCSDFK